MDVRSLFNEPGSGVRLFKETALLVTGEGSTVGTWITTVVDVPAEGVAVCPGSLSAPPDGPGHGQMVELATQQVGECK